MPWKQFKNNIDLGLASALTAVMGWSMSPFADWALRTISPIISGVVVLLFGHWLKIRREKKLREKYPQ